MSRKPVNFSRRDFIKTAGAIGVGSFLSPIGSITNAQGSSNPIEAPLKVVPTRPFGKSGVNVSILSLGGAFHYSNLLLMKQALNMGVTYWDTSPGYGGGQSEVGIGKYFEKFPEDREKVFLVCAPKNDDRKILLGGKRGWWWVKMEDQEAWTEFVNTNMTRQGDFRPPGASYSMTEVREIWGPDNQLYGFVVHQQADAVNPELVEKNTMRLWVNHAPDALSLDATFSDDGKLTNSFSLGDDVGSGIAIQSDDKIVVAGTIDDGSGSSDLNFLTQYLKR